MKPTSKDIIIIVLILVILGGSSYGYYSYAQASRRYTLLAQQQETIKKDLVMLQDQLTQAQKEKTDLVATLNDAANKNQVFADQLSVVTATAQKLEWLRQQDPQILQKYSKVYFLNENYVPKDISPIDTKYLSVKTRTLQIHQSVLPFLQNMLQAAQNENVPIQVASAYRSFSEQTALKSQYKVSYGSGANKFSADQGYSEHQLGTALDFTAPTLNGGLDGFDRTSSYTWLVNNAYKYGFIISYPKSNAYYVYEPWHWRFVGIQLATRLHNENKNFYDLEQRDIDAYLENMFKPTL